MTRSTDTIDAVGIARDYFGIEGTAIALPGYEDLNARINAADGTSYVLKVSSGAQDPAVLMLGEEAMAQIESSSFFVPTARQGVHGSVLERLPDGEIARLHTWVNGATYADRGHPGAAAPSIGRTVGELLECLAPLHTDLVRTDTEWDLRYCAETITHLASHVKRTSRRAIINKALGIISDVSIDDLPTQVIHGDLNTGNLLLHDDAVVGVVDFGDTRNTIRISELAIACAYAMLHQKDPVTVATNLCGGFREICQPSHAEASSLFGLILGRLATSACVASSVPADNPHHHDTADATWELLGRLVAADAGMIEAELRAAALGEPMSVRDTDRSLHHDRSALGPSLSLSYQEPLHIVHGSGQHLSDSRARRYLDCVNNVAHLGHNHQRVVEAATEQMAILNTNTRYLHPNVTTYAQRLASTLPEHLDTVFVVNSGSEANELAVRLARTATVRTDLVCLEAGYHGNTSTLIDVSPYKFDGPGGQGKRPGIYVLSSPDPYRDARFSGTCAAEQYRLDADEILGSAEPAALIAEALSGCGGQLMPETGVLAAAYAAVHDRGGLVIADEVQTGMGRVGDAFWAFQLHDVRPDIVTIGKPAGNGHPLAAVVTTSAIAQAFNNGMEYFNTFGGNPVSAAVGNAVLDVIHDEELQANAMTVGGAILDGLGKLSQRHTSIGDVRGSGLFIGVELVSDRSTKEPAPGIAAEVVEYAKAHGILLSVDGPHHNVLKIKPPLVFSLEDADELLVVLNSALDVAAVGSR